MTTTATTPPVAAPPTTVSAADFEALRNFLLQRSAIQITAGQEYLVDSRLGPVARQHNLPDVAAVIARVRAGDPVIAPAVLDAMTTNETSFFRDQHPFGELVDSIIPELMAAKPASEPLTIWCAACSSGQEPHTLAILLNENFPDLVQRRAVRILASDLSPTMVNRCNEARYSQFEVNRGLPAPLLVTYFEQAGRDWVLRRDVASLVRARQVNLIEPWPTMPPCDLVLLRNVLIYFANDVKARIVERIRSTVLRPRGVLMLGASESMLGFENNFESQRIDKSTWFRPKQ